MTDKNKRFGDRVIRFFVNGSEFELLLRQSKSGNSTNSGGHLFGLFVSGEFMYITVILLIFSIAAFSGIYVYLRSEKKELELEKSVEAYTQFSASYHHTRLNRRTEVNRTIRMLSQDEGENSKSAADPDGMARQTDGARGTQRRRTVVNALMDHLPTYHKSRRRLRRLVYGNRADHRRQELLERRKMTKGQTCRSTPGTYHCGDGALFSLDAQQEERRDTFPSGVEMSQLLTYDHDGPSSHSERLQMRCLRTQRATDSSPVCRTPSVYFDLPGPSSALSDPGTRSRDREPIYEHVEDDFDAPCHSDTRETMLQAAVSDKSSLQLIDAGYEAATTSNE